MTRRRSGVTSTRARIKIRRLLQHTETDMRPTMEKIAALLLDDMKASVPKDTGALADALTSFVSKNGLRAEAGLRGKKKRRDFFYARFIEFGTKGGKVSLHKNLGKKVLSDGTTFFGKEAEIPPQPARPFMQPAYDMNKDEILRLIDQMIEQSLRKAQQ